ncbi:MAG: hypothetical protein ACREDV_03095, partial [Methylocella sp.]
MAAFVCASRIVATGFCRPWTLRRGARQVLTGPYDGLAETMGCLVICCDLAGSVSSVSPNCEALFGLPPFALRGRGFFVRVQVADRPTFLWTFAVSRPGSATFEASLRWRGT